MATDPTSFSEAFTDADGLTNAYANPDRVYIYGNTLYIAGTNPTNLRDVLADATLPWGGARGSLQMTAAKRALTDHRGIARVVGHSLGGAVAFEIAKQYPDVDAVLFNAPMGQLENWPPNVRSLRHPLDPVSMIGQNMETVADATGDPHGYQDIASRSKPGRNTHRDFVHRRRIRRPKQPPRSPAKLQQMKKALKELNKRNKKQGTARTSPQPQTLPATPQARNPVQQLTPQKTKRKAAEQLHGDRRDPPTAKPPRVIIPRRRWRTGVLTPPKAKKRKATAPPDVRERRKKPIPAARDPDVARSSHE